MHAEITGWGKCMPPSVLTNQQMATVVDTSDEWIYTRSGIRERRVSHVATSQLAAVAAQRALAAAGLDPRDLDMVILATCSPDTLIPSAAAACQLAIGATNAGVFDLNAGCTGFLYGLSVATSMIKAGDHKRILVIGAERITWYLNWKHRETAVLFGDGAGAVVLEASDAPVGLLASKLTCDSGAAEALKIPYFGTASDRFQTDYHQLTIQFDGREIFRRAVKGMQEASEFVLDQAGVSKDQVDLMVPHQANIRIIEALGKFMGMPEEKVMVNIGSYGNTSAATVPVALTEALEAGRVKPNSTLLLAAFGAGLTCGAGLLRWGDRVQPIGLSDAELPPCDQSALEILGSAINASRAG
jgi:3-oxoacyl-[acyl-carrier-protein] synthase-3